MHNILLSMSKQMEDLKYQDYVKQVQALNRLKSYLATNYQSLEPAQKDALIK